MDQVPVTGQPAECALYQPSAGHHHEPGDGVGAFDDGHGQTQHALCPRDEASGLAAVDPDQSDRGEPLTQRQQSVGAVAVLHAGGSNDVGAAYGLSVDDRRSRQFGPATRGTDLTPQPIGKLRSLHRSKNAYTASHGGKSAGIARRSCFNGAPAEPLRNSAMTARASGSSTFHCSSVRSDGYRRARLRHAQPETPQLALTAATGQTDIRVMP
ncbi:hypothetical protein [Allokutzneria albata]|uniref:hypothetical protein n=1 Tax=Allokutzneria albata TaxID=211114 RepID=UPI0012DBDB50|nr:hypothetical protein [Allokutzneria albata]